MMQHKLVGRISKNMFVKMSSYVFYRRLLKFEDNQDESEMNRCRRARHDVDAGGHGASGGCSAADHRGLPAGMMHSARLRIPSEMTT